MRLRSYLCLTLLATAGCPAPELRPTPPPPVPDAGPPEAAAAPPLDVQPGPPALLLAVELTGFRSDRGLARVSLFEAPAGFPEDHTRARRVWVGPIQEGRCRVEWAGLERGTYAVAAIHDEDEDERLDRGLFGVPAEGFGVSNDPPLRLGLPRFEDATFALEPPGRELHVGMRYF